ncbi:hypothetical protein, partial [Paenibacillus alvei]
QTHGAHQNVVPNSFQPTGQVQSITAQTHGAQQNVVPTQYQSRGPVGSITASTQQAANEYSSSSIVQSVSDQSYTS